MEGRGWTGPAASTKKTEAGPKGLKGSNPPKPLPPGAPPLRCGYHTRENEWERLFTAQREGREHQLRATGVLMTHHAPPERIRSFALHTATALPSALGHTAFSLLNWTTHKPPPWMAQCARLRHKHHYYGRVCWCPYRLVWSRSNSALRSLMDKPYVLPLVSTSPCPKHAPGPPSSPVGEDGSDALPPAPTAWPGCSARSGRVRDARRPVTADMEEEAGRVEVPSGVVDRPPAL